MKRAVVIGAGFSGLVSAYYLQKAGYLVQIYEKEEAPGGLIQTTMTSWGRVESAANGFLASYHLEELADEIGLRLDPASSRSRKRFIFRARPRRWPLSITETLIFIFRFIFSRKEPLARQSISLWGDRVLGEAGRRYVLSPALQGIYAGDPEKLSSYLIMSRFFSRRKKKTRRGRLKGTVAPPNGMGEFVTTLEKFLKTKGVVFHYGKRMTELASLSMADEVMGHNGPHQNVYIIATGAAATTALLTRQDGLEPSPLAKNVVQALAQVDLLPVITVTAFFAADEVALLQGFGCLMPRDQGFRALGVLFNSSIFKAASPHRSETWIFGGATDRDFITKTDTEILAQIDVERERLYANGRDHLQAPRWGKLPRLFSKPLSKPMGFKIQRWPQGIPHYSVEHEELLGKNRQSILDLESEGVYHTGNYLGALGLSQILERTREMVQRIESRK